MPEVMGELAAQDLYPDETGYQPPSPGLLDYLRSGARTVVSGINTASDYLGVPRGEIRNAAGDVVFPTNALERGLQGSSDAQTAIAASVMGPGKIGKAPINKLTSAPAEARTVYRGEGIPIEGWFETSHPKRYDPGFLGSDAIYSTSAPHLASDYAMLKAAKEIDPAPNVMPLKLSMENPKVIDQAERVRLSKMDQFDRNDWLQKNVYGAGHDGVIVKYDKGYEEYAARPHQYSPFFGKESALEAPAIVKAPAGIRAYHGSPYDFDRFDLSKVGTGEGAQVYGHGLYFAENEAVARDYRRRLAPGNSDMIRPDEEAIAAIQPQWDQTVSKLREAREKSGGRITGETSALQNLLDALHANAVDDTLSRKPYLTKGRMYEVNINAAPEHFIDYNKPFSQQSDVVQKGLRSLPFQEWRFKKDALGREQMGSDFAPRSDLFLNTYRDAGIPGIRYLDQGSRNKSDYGARKALLEQAIQRGAPPEEIALRQRGVDDVRPTYNYVVNNPDIVDILKKYAIVGAIPPMMGALAAQDQYGN